MRVVWASASFVGVETCVVGGSTVNKRCTFFICRRPSGLCWRQPYTNSSKHCMRVRIGKLHTRASCASNSARKMTHIACARPVYPASRAQFCWCQLLFRIAYVGPGPFPHPQGRLVGVSLMRRCMTPPIFAAGWGTYWRHYSYPLTPKSISVAG
jgi:hypothetical protein